jgi:hypothetical protein
MGRKRNINDFFPEEFALSPYESPAFSSSIRPQPADLSFAGI